MRLMTLLGFILTAIVLIADAITGVVGVIATVKKWVIGEPTPTVRLNVKTVNDGGDTCLEFVFFDLPESFQLDHVRLDVVGTAKVEKIPPMAGVQYSMTKKMVSIPTYYRTAYVTQNHVDKNDPIIVKAKIRSEKALDSAYLDVFLTPKAPDVLLQISVVPSFISVDGEQIQEIKVVASDGGPFEGSVDLTLRSKGGSTLSGPQVRRGQDGGICFDDRNVRLGEFRDLLDLLGIW